ncbi:MAG TPA: hotdog domain-containing protein [Nocardioides sp.]|nr:hotdog domain-containing protein [Nocardioides sp.]
MQQLRFANSHPRSHFGSGEYRQSADGVDGVMELGGWSVGPGGAPAVGALGVFADEVLGYALMASMPPGGWSISTEIWIDVLAPLPAPGTALTGCAQARRPGAFSTGELRDPRGRVVALCRQRGRATSAPGSEHHVALDGIVDAQGIEALLGLETDGTAYLLHARPHLLNPLAMLHGGVSLAASEVAASRSRAAQGCELPTTSVHIVHSRGVPLGGVLELSAETRHAGRTLWVTEVIGRVGGRTCTVATITAQT